MDTRTKNRWMARARFLTEEEFDACMINADDDGKTCEDKIKRVCGCFASETMDAFIFFREIYPDIPDKYKMRCLLDCVYQSYKIDYPLMLEMIADYLKQESAELKTQRIETNKMLLKDAGVENPESITVWRGIAENNLLPAYAVSWSLSKETADWFIQHHKTRHGARFGFVSQQQVAIENVLYYSDNRKEQEVYVIPDVVLNGCLPEYDEDLGILDYVGFDEYQWQIFQHEGWDEEPDDLFE